MKLFAEINKAKEEHNVQEEEDMCHSKPAKNTKGCCGYTKRVIPVT
jgi:hypothetical protein